MKIEINLFSRTPAVIQIRDQVKQRIVLGELRFADSLPPIRELAAELGVNFNTVARAYRLLDSEGWISTQQGRGTYVRSRITESESETLRKESLDKIVSQFLEQAESLGFTHAEALSAVEKRMRDEGRRERNQMFHVKGWMER